MQGPWSIPSRLHLPHKPSVVFHQVDGLPPLSQFRELAPVFARHVKTHEFALVPVSAVLDVDVPKGRHVNHLSLELPRRPDPSRLVNVVFLLDFFAPHCPCPPFQPLTPQASTAAEISNHRPSSRSSPSGGRW